MAIHCAHKDDARRCLSRLLSVGASPEADSKGHPLHTALENEDYDSVTVLLASQVKVLPSFDGLFPSNCHGDSHAAFEDGLSRLVCLTKEGREELRYTRPSLRNWSFLKRRRFSANSQPGKTDLFFA